MKFRLIPFFILFSLVVFSQNKQKEVLMVGTFHFNNPGYDVVKTKTFDVLSEKSQKELEILSSKIKEYNPSKIFVEWEFDKQTTLDSLYDLYQKGTYDDYVTKKYPKRTFYTQNEIVQLAFRTAKKLGHSKVYAIDYQYAGEFPYDSLMKEIETAKQLELRAEIDKSMADYTKQSNIDRQTKTLTQLILGMNTPEFRKFDKSAYITYFNRGGGKDNFVGAYLNSEWYKRNLYMYALMQKNIEEKDKKVMVLLGASHVAMFEGFIENDSKLKAIELNTILK